MAGAASLRWEPRGEDEGAQAVLSGVVKKTGECHATGLCLRWGKGPRPRRDTQSQDGDASFSVDLEKKKWLITELNVFIDHPGVTAH